MYIALDCIPGSTKPCKVQVTVSDGSGKDLGTTYFAYHPNPTHFESYFGNVIPHVPEPTKWKEYRIKQEKELLRSISEPVTILTAGKQFVSSLPN